MRYFKMVLKTSAKEIEENTKVKLREYGYGSPINSLNEFMQRKIKNGLSFVAYREEEENSLLAGFSYDEKYEKLDAIYSYIMEMLKDAFFITRVKIEPTEITMFEYVECVNEAKRRDFGSYTHNFMRSANLWFYEYDWKSLKHYNFDFEEVIIEENDKKISNMYDSKFQDEITNIDNHKNSANYNGNMVHYIISGRSPEAYRDMTKTLVASLIRANRVKSKRIEFISNLEPDFYKSRNLIEDIIENNYGGTIVFDLTEKFGFDASDYLRVCQYIENLIKKYKNECLFVFTYNMEKTGFSYYLLPQLKKYVIPVMLREGNGNRISAINYLKALIEQSEYSNYAYQAAEFLKQYPGNLFSQTDILQAHEQFEAWCLNKNVFHAYHYELPDDFMLDRNENVELSYEKLQKMIGLNSVKKQIDEIIATNIVEMERKNRKRNKYHSGTMHMIFAGNPGTAKTTVGRLFAEIAKQKGILKSGVFVETSGLDLDGFCCDHLIREAFVAAKGGVLFIDEAYSLKSDTAVTVLIQEMENRRDEVIVILAGYNERMEAFLEINEGLKSRIPYWIDFPDYNADELTLIFKSMVKDKGMKVTDSALKEAHYIFDKKRYQENFGNGRYVRNLIEHVIQKQSNRLLEKRRLQKK